MAIKRTYFMNRMADGELAELLARRESFFLENVADVDALAVQLSAKLAAMGRTVRVRNDRYSLGKDMARMVLPWWVGVYSLFRILIDTVDIWLARPYVEIVIIQRALSLECRYTPRPDRAKAGR
jgi:hypothetical protein